jgi:dTDP-4-amino-4,6-dideoxygalactose transaminase
MVPFIDLRGQYRDLKPEIDAAVLRVLESGQFALGPEVAEFEQEFAAYVGTRHAVAVNSGTSALHLALLALGIETGDEVITTPMTFIATAAAIRYVGATPKFVDIAPDTYTIDPALIERAITPRTRAILPVHLYGQMAAMDDILDVANRHSLPVIEDAAQAHGAKDAQGRPAGSFGRAGCFSFYPTKSLGACGEGGLLVTNDDAIASASRARRDWGQSARYQHTLLGYNYRMDGIQGAILRVKLGHLERWTEARRAHAGRYRTLLGEAGVRLPYERPGTRHVFHVYAIRSTQRDALRRHLDATGIQTGVHYPTPLHLQPVFADLGHRRGDFPVAESLAAEQLSLPIFAELTAAQIRDVAVAVKAFEHVVA